MEQLSGKTALVTGSTDGVGRLVARKLGQAGARVLVHGRDAERGARVVADIARRPTPSVEPVTSAVFPLSFSIPGLLTWLDERDYFGMPGVRSRRSRR